MTLVYKVTTTLLFANVFLRLFYDFLLSFSIEQGPLSYVVESVLVYLYGFLYSFKAGNVIPSLESKLTVLFS